MTIKEKGELKIKIAEKKSLSSPIFVAYLLILPSVLVIFSVVIWPILDTFYISFHRMYLVHREEFPFIGLANYNKILHDFSFWASVGRTFYFTGVSVAVEIVLGLGIALVLNQKFKGRAFMRGLMLLPWALSSVVNGMMWKWIYNSNYGALNGLLLQLGWIDSYKAWLADPKIAMNLIICAEIWKETPVATLFILAALQTIPVSLHEAARVDGANTWARFKHVTFPLLKPTLSILIIIKSIWAITDSFDIVYMISRGGPAGGTQVVTFYTYLNTFRFLRFGYGAAMAYLITLFILILVIAYMRLFYRETIYPQAV